MTIIFEMSKFLRISMCIVQWNPVDTEFSPHGAFVAKLRIGQTRCLRSGSARALVVDQAGAFSEKRVEIHNHLATVDEGHAQPVAGKRLHGLEAGHFIMDAISSISLYLEIISIWHVWFGGQAQADGREQSNFSMQPGNP